MYKKIRIFISLCTVVILALCVIQYNKELLGDRDIFLKGNGTKNEPYEINTKEDIIWLREEVNQGTEFRNTYFLQMRDIDLENEEWIPIGEFDSEKYFFGIYDGGNHKIYNLKIRGDKCKSSNVGLFGYLEGTICNLGIESGIVEGSYVGAFTSHSSENALIANCYNKATIIGTARAGGIADNFSGTNINCANEGVIESSCPAEIVSYNAKNLTNVYPVQNAYTQTFKGSFVQCINEEISGSLDIFEWLNSGVTYFDENEIFESDLVRKWLIQ